MWYEQGKPAGGSPARSSVPRSGGAKEPEKEADDDDGRTDTRSISLSFIKEQQKKMFYVFTVFKSQIARQGAS